MNTYEPNPVNTSEVTLPDEFLELAELLAEHTHDVWAQQRIAEGWVYGNVRDDEKKTHPCLVPYTALPEKEKEYDRNTSQQVLKVLYKMGYRLTKE